MIRTRNAVRDHISKMADEAIENFMLVLKKNELPMTEEQLERDFSNFLVGHFEGDAPEETATAGNDGVDESSSV